MRSLLLLAILVSGCGHDSSTLTVKGRAPRYPEPPKGSPALFREVILPGVSVGRATWCDPDNPAPGHFIPVTHGGDLPFDAAPRGGCVLKADGTMVPFTAPAAGVQVQCATINTHAFIMAMIARFKEKGIRNIGAGIHRCPAAPLGGRRGSLETFRRGIMINDWNDANRAVEAVAWVMKRWRLRATVDVRVKSIPIVDILQAGR